MPANSVVIPNSELFDELTALIAASAPLDGAVVRLIKAPLTPTPATPLASFTEADFTGYVHSTTIVWGTAFYLPDGQAAITSDLKTFTVGASPTILNTIYGFLVTDQPATKWMFCRIFDTPIVLTQAGNAIQVIATRPGYQTP